MQNALKYQAGDIVKVVSTREDGFIGRIGKVVGPELFHDWAVEFGPDDYGAFDEAELVPAA